MHVRYVWPPETPEPTCWLTCKYSPYSASLSGGWRPEPIFHVKTYFANSEPCEILVKPSSLCKMKKKKSSTIFGPKQLPVSADTAGLTIAGSHGGKSTSAVSEYIYVTVVHL